MKRTHAISIISLAGAISVATVYAQELGPGGFDLSWNTIDGGGGTSAGGAIELQGTIGQPDAGAQVMTGGGFSLTGGFWPTAGPQISTCPADIAPTPSGDGLVNIDDLLAVINGWGSCATPCPPHCVADVTQNCEVNIDDLLVVINAWGACP
jgi:hypothetical protein